LRTPHHRTRGTGPMRPTLPTGKWSTPSMLSIRQWPHSRPSPMRTATMADRNRTIEDTDPRQFVQGRLDLSGRRFLRLRFVAQECGLGHARVYKRDIGIGRPRPGPCAHIIRLGFTRAQLAKIGLPYQSGKIARRYGGPVRENRGRGRNGNRSERSPLPRPRDSGSPR